MRLINWIIKTFIGAIIGAAVFGTAIWFVSALFGAYWTWIGTARVVFFVFIITDIFAAIASFSDKIDEYKYY